MVRQSSVCRPLLANSKKPKANDSKTSAEAEFTRVMPNIANSERRKKIRFLFAERKQCQRPAGANAGIVSDQRELTVPITASAQLKLTSKLRSKKEGWPLDWGMYKRSI